MSCERKQFRDRSDSILYVRPMVGMADDTAVRNNENNNCITSSKDHTKVN
jgi:hypothetical protein